MSIRYARLGGKCRRAAALLTIAVAASGAQGDSARAKPRLVGIIDGFVSDSALAPLDKVTVSFVGAETQVVTGANGKFRFLEVPAGRYRILARRIGSEPVIAEVEVTPGQVTRPALMLEPAVTVLNAVRVETKTLSPKLMDFDRRRRAGEGQFLTAAEMEKHPAVSIADHLGRMQGIRIYRDTALNRRFSVTRPCAMDVYLDNIPMGPKLSDLPSPKEIAAIEVYSGPATMPLQFKRPTGVWCGIIMIWTKDGSTP